MYDMKKEKEEKDDFQKLVILNSSCIKSIEYYFRTRL